MILLYSADIPWPVFASNSNLPTIMKRRVRKRSGFGIKYLLWLTQTWLEMPWGLKKTPTQTWMERSWLAIKLYVLVTTKMAGTCPSVTLNISSGVMFMSLTSLWSHLKKFQWFYTYRGSRVRLFLSQLLPRICDVEKKTIINLSCVPKISQVWSKKLSFFLGYHNFLNALRFIWSKNIYLVQQNEKVKPTSAASAKS